MREIKTLDTTNGQRFKVRYRLAGRQTSETFTRLDDARVFRDILGNGRGDRVAQALAWLQARRSDSLTTDLTFGTWFETYVDQLTGITPRTRGDYRSIHRRYLSHLDHLPLPLLTRTHITTLVNTLDTAGRSPKTIKLTVHLLSTCLGLAIDEGHMTSNPCRRVRLPERTLAAVEARFLSYDEAAALVAAMPEHYKPLVVFMLGTGMRWSEATAIQTRHVNLDAGTVRVEQAWKRVPNEGFVLGVPKSNRARRTVNAATMALAAVQPLLGKPRDLVFKTASGGRVSHANFYTNIWRPACARAGLEPAPRIHDLRHTHASWLISDGISLEAVQDQLGHESIETTRKVYAHLVPAVGVALGKAASAALQRALVAEEREDTARVERPELGRGDLAAG
jgi:integrase